MSGNPHEMTSAEYEAYVEQLVAMVDSPCKARPPRLAYESTPNGEGDRLYQAWLASKPKAT
jgi:hypothetical protein